MKETRRPKHNYQFRASYHDAGRIIATLQDSGCQARVPNFEGASVRGAERRAEGVVKETRRPLNPKTPISPGRFPKQAFAEYLLENPTWPERILWSRISRKQIGFSFQRQASVRGFIVDFWCPVARLVIELDGSVHALPEKAQGDKRRDAIFAKAKIDCLRFDNSDVYRGMSAVLIRIWEHCYARAPYPLKHPIEAESRSSSEETSEIRALRQIQEAKRLEQHEVSFIHRYRKNRWFDRGRKAHV